MPEQEDLVQKIIEEGDRIEEDARYSAKSHFEAARDWDNWHLSLGIPASVAAGIAGVSALSDHPLISAVLAFLVAATAGLLTFLNPKERSAQHLKAGNAYKGLQNDARIFRKIDCRLENATNELRQALGQLNDRRNTLNVESPQIPRRAFWRARKGIEEGEATYRVDEKSD